MPAEEKKKLLEFPCQYPLVVVCDNDPKVKEEIKEVVKKLDPKFLETESLVENHSSGKKYVSLRFTLYATSQEQLDSIYMAVGKCKGVQFAL